MNCRVLLLGVWLVGAGCGWAADEAAPTPVKQVEIKRVAVDSSNLAEVGYDKEGRVLEIKFHKGGVYRYSDVPRKTHSALMKSENKGTYFRQHIRGKFHGEHQPEELPKDVSAVEKSNKP